jgi:ABC-type uncharacterized transport system fused permease/ATPase subunit
LIRQNLKLNTFVSSYFQASVVFPFVIMAPAYFAGKLTLGQLTQTAGAFGRVEGAMQWFIARYQSLASYKAIVDRLTTFGDAINAADKLRDQSGITLPSQPARNLTIPALSLAIPNGDTIVAVQDLTFKSGESTLVTGPSGSGKSTLFRAISGIWPFGSGQILVPDGKSVMLLPQRPYIPIGTLREAVQYPGLAGDRQARVAAGEADAGIVYATDVSATQGAAEGVVIPTDVNVTADYPIAAVSTSTNRAAAQAWIAFVRGTEGQAILKSYGFGSP